jgi:uncharacterized protein with PhoU and TrkA domain
MRPRTRTIIEAGDVIIASGYAEGEEDFRRLIGAESSQLGSL